jgi:hypothetical protein
LNVARQALVFLQEASHGEQVLSLLTANREVLLDPAMRAIAARFGSSVAQVVFHVALQSDMLPLTGITSAQHMKDDLAAEQFTLSSEERPPDRDSRTVAVAPRSIYPSLLVRAGTLANAARLGAVLRREAMKLLMPFLDRRGNPRRKLVRLLGVLVEKLR